MLTEVRCPVEECRAHTEGRRGKRLALVEGPAGVIWRDCPQCGAVVRHEIGTGVTEVARGPNQQKLDRLAQRGSYSNGRYCA